MNDKLGLVLISAKGLYPVADRDVPGLTELSIFSIRNSNKSTGLALKNVPQPLFDPPIQYSNYESRLKEKIKCPLRFS